MAKFYDQVTPELADFIHAQKVFFVATAAQDGRVNLSPKGMDSIRVIDPNTVVWLNLTGSGNETAAHLLKQNRMTIMQCAFEGKPQILRIYGTATMHHEGDEVFEQHIDLFPSIAGTRQIVEVHVESLQTSCGYAVPFMEFVGDRRQLEAWAEKQGEERLEKYKAEKNARSIDGLETGLPVADDAKSES